MVNSSSAPLAAEKSIISGDLSVYLLLIVNTGDGFGGIIPNYSADGTGPFYVSTTFLAIAGLYPLFEFRRRMLVT